MRFRLLATGSTVVLLVAASCVSVDIAVADVATATHVAACNDEAQEAARMRTASPNVRDEAQAADARNADPRALERTDPTGRMIKSPDPQLDGMNVEGAKNAVYRAAYRVCMRRSGF